MTRRTYWHLEGRASKPTDYDIATTRLLYYPSRGLEVKTPAGAWLERYGKPRLHAKDWDAFSDPRQTTYARYCELQRRQEIYVDGLLQSAESGQLDRSLEAPCVALLERVLPVLRFPVHALQMAAAYVGHLAPGGRVAVVCAFQAGDELRRLHRIAYRMAMLRQVRPDFGDSSRLEWEREPAWQPLRELIERLLATWDFTDALVALNQVVKPAFDEAVMAFAESARVAGDGLTRQLFESLNHDCSWHRAWFGALVEHLLTEDVENRRIIEAVAQAWQPRADAAVEAMP